MHWMVLICKILNSHHHVWLKLAQWFCKRLFFFWFFDVFSLHYYLSLKRGRDHLNKLESASLKDALCQVWSKLDHWFWLNRFFNSVNSFLLFHYYLPLEKDVVLHMSKLESTSPKDVLCQVWMKLAQWFWRSFYNFVKVF